MVFDEAFVRAAKVHEPTAVERLVAAAQARADAAGSRGGPLATMRTPPTRGPATTTATTTPTASTIRTAPTEAPSARTAPARAGTAPSPGWSPC